MNTPNAIRNLCRRFTPDALSGQWFDELGGFRDPDFLGPPARFVDSSLSRHRAEVVRDSPQNGRVITYGLTNCILSSPHLRKGWENARLTLTAAEQFGFCLPRSQTATGHFISRHTRYR